MNDMLILSIVGLASLVILLFVLHFLNKSRLNSLKTEHQKLEQQSTLFKQHLIQIEESLNDMRAGNLELGEKLKGVAGQVNEISEQVNEVAEQQEHLVNSEPENRLYSKASKMAAQGATVDELMQDCELPKAEAELLVSLHNRDQD